MSVQTDKNDNMYLGGDINLTSPGATVRDHEGNDLLTGGGGTGIVVLSSTIVDIADIEGVNQNLYTVPEGKICVPVGLAFYRFSVAPADFIASVTGFDNDNFIMDSTEVAISRLTRVATLWANNDFYGVEGEVLRFVVNQPHPDPATVRCDFRGYLIDA